MDQIKNGGKIRYLFFIFTSINPLFGFIERKIAYIYPKERFKGGKIEIKNHKIFLNFFDSKGPPFKNGKTFNFLN